jgi:cysteinyl-tRNA synthetase
MNTSGAISVLFDLAAAATEVIAAGAASRAASFLHEAMTLVGLSPVERAHAAAETETAAMMIGDRAFTLVLPADAEAHLPADTVERLRASAHGLHNLNGATKTQAVNALIFARIQAKMERDFALADRLRAALTGVGVTVNDAKDGATWTVGA